MKVLDILVEHPDGRMEVRTEFSAKELQTLIQFAVNMSASIGLGAAKQQQEQQELDLGGYTLND